jgi:hypothetical protein
MEADIKLAFDILAFTSVMVLIVLGLGVPCSDMLPRSSICGVRSGAGVLSVFDLPSNVLIRLITSVLSRRITI